MQQYRRVLRNADRLREPLPDRRRGDLLGLLAYECYLTNVVDDALAARHEALAIWTAVSDAERVGDTHRWLSRLNYFAGNADLAEHHARCAVDEPWRGPTRSSSRWRTATWLSYACSAPTSSVPAGGAAGRWRFSGGCPRARSGNRPRYTP